MQRQSFQRPVFRRSGTVIAMRAMAENLRASSDTAGAERVEDLAVAAKAMSIMMNMESMFIRSSQNNLASIARAA